MDVFNVVALLIALTAFFAYLNHWTLRLPTTIGVMGLALFFSLVLIALGRLGLVGEAWTAWFEAVDFGPTLLQGMLGFLLFAGALHVDLGDLLDQKGVVTFLATVGVLLSTAAVGGVVYVAFGALGFELPLLYCLLFGALISPTDPIAVLSILKKAGIPRSLEMKIAAESLFNDGVGVVVFLVILGAIAGGSEVTFSEIALLFLEEVAGGILLGLVAGAIVYRMLRSIDDYQVEILLTLALVTGGYALATALHLSGPLAMVAAGLLIGNHGRRFAMSDRTREHLDTFWKLVDEMLNAVLFVMIGLEVLVLSFDLRLLTAGLLAVPLVLAVRFASVGLGVRLLRRRRSFSPHVVKIIAWSGIRGGISVALALSLPAGPERTVILAVTYTVVAFSILVQGPSVAPLVRKLYRTR
jgi:CPA1 family monovalent cation:H+ antiporter